MPITRRMGFVGQDLSFLIIAVNAARYLEDRINKRCHHRSLGEDQQGSHQDDRDDQGSKPILFADLEKVPNIFEQLKKSVH